MSKDRASKIVKPGEAIVVDDAPHKVQKITQGKRGKGGGYVRLVAGSVGSNLVDLTNSLTELS
jgi:translation elongation factor P/translation initiation factor 5A